MKAPQCHVAESFVSIESEKYCVSPDTNGPGKNFIERGDEQTAICI